MSTSYSSEHVRVILQWKGTLQIGFRVKGLEMETFSWIIWMGSKFHHKGPYKGEVG